MVKPNWLDKSDLIDASSWEPIDEEVDGSTIERTWVINKITKEKALFKPDVGGNVQSHVEYTVSRIAEFLEVSAARISVGEFLGKYGCFSHDCNDGRRYRVVDGDSLYRCDKLFNNRLSDTNNLVYNSPIEMSFKGLLPYISKDTEMDLVNMCLLDMTIKNCDRHGGNYSFYINNQRVIVGLMSLYDHGLSLWNSRRDISLFTYEGMYEESFTDLFIKISKDYPNVVKSWLTRMNDGQFIELLHELECYEFVMPRITKFTDLYANQIVEGLRFDTMIERNKIVEDMDLFD